MNDRRIGDSLPISADESRTLERLQERLARSAAADDALDVSYRSYDSPVGTLLLAATPLGLVRVAFATEGHDAVLSSLSERLGSRILSSVTALSRFESLDASAAQLDEYFAGRRKFFTVPLDRQLSTGFRRSVLESLTRIEYGHTASYGQVAALAGSPKAFRAVGTACATNPLPILVPCHRVVRGDGGQGGYLGGPEAKHTLLSLEAQHEQ
ncbi:methylated-DNA--[protein]-cysteine S-methyltransferase [Lysinibacter cavernae]|uniref:methylated-DNA--[protein]-cysteine S-methyltransferase n=1 Tax=Lysinibacter cavernae TaxID=1640652 RepID=A0A7X5R023_9MICO|nr:methylated-DNA--[protein]-cysteine S-methyltransferase [Lysinibacter cavernae]NIH53134.1 methylated-DNA-[protein]-cysteine S-methyltransferase [Lysinibacter cavernae]